MKRYAIVRVDEGCPVGNSVFKEIELQNVCNASKNCSSCLIGDTKEQLIRKVAQVMKRRYCIDYVRTTMQDKINSKHLKSAYDYYLDIAREIVEFLGVE